VTQEITSAGEIAREIRRQARNMGATGRRTSGGANLDRDDFGLVADSREYYDARTLRRLGLEESLGP
jgi:hypothetical protein